MPAKTDAEIKAELIATLSMMYVTEDVLFTAFDQAANAAGHAKRSYVADPCEENKLAHAEAVARKGQHRAHLEFVRCGIDVTLEGIRERMRRGNLPTGEEAEQ